MFSWNAIWERRLNREALSALSAGKQGRDHPAAESPFRPDLSAQKEYRVLCFPTVNADTVSVESPSAVRISLAGLKKVTIAFTLLVTTVTFGTAGYHLVEKMSWFDGLYMTVITISSVGFQEVVPLSSAGRIITIIIIVTGIAIAGYAVSSAVRMIIEGELQKSFGRRKVEKQISNLNGHYIVCGYGRIGKLIVRELEINNRAFVIIENDPEEVKELRDGEYLHIPLDATADESLVLAGIHRARAIVPVVRSDSDNVFITLTARGLNPDIFILARASEEKNEVKLRRAGATRVVSPYMIGGRRMAQVLIKPTVVDFIDIAIMENNLGLQMEETIIKAGSHLIGKNLIESNLRKDYGVIIVLIKKANGQMIFNPGPAEIIGERDVLVVMGKTEDMIRMSEII
jgi:voltage-gated potassium channel